MEKYYMLTKKLQIDNSSNGILKVKKNTVGTILITIGEAALSLLGYFYFLHPTLKMQLTKELKYGLLLGIALLTFNALSNIYMLIQNNEFSFDKNDFGFRKNDELLTRFENINHIRINGKSTDDDTSNKYDVWVVANQDYLIGYNLYKTEALKVSHTIAKFIEKEVKGI